MTLLMGRFQHLSPIPMPIPLIRPITIDDIFITKYAPFLGKSCNKYCKDLGGDFPPPGSKM